MLMNKVIDSPWVKRCAIILERYSYVVLITICGALAFFEGLRLKSLYPKSFFMAGPGGYLVIIGVILLLFSGVEGAGLVLRLSAHKKSRAQVHDREESIPEKTENEDIPAVNRANMYLTYIFCVLYVVLIKPLGFTIASVIYLALNLFFLKNGKITTLITLVVIFLILHYGAPAIGLSLPRGLIGF